MEKRYSICINPLSRPQSRRDCFVENHKNVQVLDASVGSAVRHIVAAVDVVECLPYAIVFCYSHWSRQCVYALWHRLAGACMSSSSGQKQQEEEKEVALPRDCCFLMKSCQAFADLPVIYEQLPDACRHLPFTFTRFTQFRWISPPHGWQRQHQSGPAMHRLPR